ncbi:hypothetical protein [Acidicapsa acidisoli]|uniref:hypothetical protein n=1 Tax=Acidicapsa acidisoli TaxID=1615681 RepID=UPI0021E0339D|nr:hypothetical protein [Acidicapsa acidisoli]
MRRNSAVLLLLLVFAGLDSATAKSKKPSLPEAFETAHTVFVETRDGVDITDIRLDPDDRNAILDVQDGIQDWGRYTLSRSRRDADLILVVYKGRIVRDQPNSATPGTLRIPGGHSPIQDPADASQSGTGNPSPDGLREEKDQLWVYTIQSDGKLKGPIWRSEQERGLSGPNVMLLRRLKDEVEKSYPNAPPKPQPTP